MTDTGIIEAPESSSSTLFTKYLKGCFAIALNCLKIFRKIFKRFYEIFAERKDLLLFWKRWGDMTQSAPSLPKRMEAYKGMVL